MMAVSTRGEGSTLRAALSAVSVVVGLTVASGAHALTPADVFRVASPSVVVVVAADVSGIARKLGSGVAIGTDAVITNCHVIENSATIVVQTAEQRKLPARLVYADQKLDLCQLGVPLLGAPAAQLGSERSMSVGARVYAIGAPQGLDLTLSEGLISGVRTTRDGPLIQTTAPISHGSSGGGLFNDEGLLVGITTFYFASGQSLNFAVPAERIRALPSQASQRAAGAMLARYFCGRHNEYLYKGERRRQLDIARAWVRVSPENAAAWNILGSALDHNGEDGLAVDAYRKALQLAPSSAAISYNLGRQYLRIGDPKAAIEPLERASRDPALATDAFLFAALGEAYERSGMWNDALGARRAAVRLQKGDVLFWEDLASACIATGRMDEALDALQEVVRLEPKSTFRLCRPARGFKKNSDQGLRLMYARLRHVGSKFEYAKDCKSGPPPGAIIGVRPFPLTPETVSP